MCGRFARYFKQMRYLERVIKMNNYFINIFDTTTNKTWCEEFDSYDITITTFVTTNNSKNKIINELVLDFEQNNIIIPNNKKLINELSFYESSITKNNSVTFNAKIGQHDDLVISLAIGNNFIKKLNI